MKKLLLSFICLVLLNQSFGKEIKLFSPDKKTEVTFSIDSNLRIKVSYLAKELFRVDNISLDLTGKSFITGIKKVKEANTNSIDRKIYPVIKEKYKVLNEKFNELNIDFKGDYSFIIRAYDNGVAYRFQTTFEDSIVVENENLDLVFGDLDSMYFQKSKTFNSSYETPYEHSAIKDVTTDGYCCLPALVKKPNGINVLIAESDLDDYPGLWLKGTGNVSLTSAHAGYPIAFNYEGSPYGQGQVKKHADFIAKTTGNRSFPWRVFAISEDDAGLISNTLVYQLAKPTQIEDVSWIKPGIITFDWWGRR
ncbi:MAG: glycoside hydrolase family 97 N-terminal domain-containing protein, partial [Cyclobacteriaceae bacterium]|nr:glycoside hydrolase family 97 N-terminal domain-containing protein [Cyclobacteriaceae bacterium]